MEQQKTFASGGHAEDDGFGRQDGRRLFGEPDVVCVFDYLCVYQGKAVETPERRLMAAVLRDGIDCYIRDCFAANRLRKRSYREAEEWFFQGNEKDVFSLENVCDVLNIDPGYVRRGLNRYKERVLADATSRRNELSNEAADLGYSLAS